MARNAYNTRHPALDLLTDRSIPSGSPAVITDLIEADIHQWALFFRWGNPPLWIMCNLTNTEATIEYVSPAGVEFATVGIMMAGDGGFVVDSTSGANVHKKSGEVVITHDKDTNGTQLSVRTKPKDLTASYTGAEHAEYHVTDLWYGDSETALKTDRKLRIEDNTNNSTKVARTLRIAVPSTVKVYGLLIDPIHRNI